MIHFPAILAASQRSIYHHAALNPWLLGVIILAAAAMILYLYRAQQRIASRGVVVTLTCLRLLLVLCVLVLLLQPAIRWTHHHASAGTLWLMVDASGSMATTDPQSSPIERLRWADALGYLPAGTRKIKLDQSVADLTALRSDLARLQFLPANSKENDPNNDAASSLRGWTNRLDEAITQLESAAKSQPAASAISIMLSQTSRLVSPSTSSESSHLASPAAPAPWPRLAADLDLAIRTLAPIADREDADFLARHGKEAPITDALSKVSRLSRSELAQLSLAFSSKQSLAELFPSYHIRLLPFADRAEEAVVGPADPLPQLLQQAMASTGQATSLSAALQHIAEQTSPDEPASVLILSDGRQNVDGDATVPARQLAAQGAHVYSLAVGSDQLSIDAAIEAVDTPDWVYKDDAVRAAVRVRADGLAAKEISAELWRDGAKLDTKKLTPAKPHDVQSISFEDLHPPLGVHDYEVRIPAIPGEENLTNNHQMFRVAVKENRLSILVIEDQPRWEYRHLVSYLSRDPRVKLQTVLLQPTQIQNVSPPAPVKASPLNPRTEAQLLPQTKPEWLAFDVVILGDIPAASLPPDQQLNLLAAVREAGKALIFIAGPRNLPAGFANAPLNEALPVSLVNNWSAPELAEQQKLGFHVQMTPAGAASILSQFKPDPAENLAAWAAIPPWYWHSEQTVAKPSATVLWAIDSADSEAVAAQRRRALLATSMFGTGRVLYLAADQTWRLRQVNGENLQDRFWGQVIRWAAGNELPAGGAQLRFGTDKPSYTQGESLILTARLNNPDHSPLTGQSIEVVAQVNPAATTQPASQPITSREFATAKLIEVPDAPGVYRATLAGLPAGAVELSLRGPSTEALLADVTDPRQKSISLSVRPRLTIEQRDLNTDKPRLAEIAKAGNGIALDGPYASTLARYIPRPSIEQTTIEQFGFFGDPQNHYTRLTHWIFLSIFCVLITTEWIIRKAVGLV
jgi:hypothetical protein